MEAQFNIQNLIGDTVVTLFHYPKEGEEGMVVLKVGESSTTLDLEQLDELAKCCHRIVAYEEVEAEGADEQAQAEGAITFNESAFY